MSLMKTLKYQQDTLASLRQYLSLARSTAPKVAFDAATAGPPLPCDATTLP